MNFLSGYTTTQSTSTMNLLKLSISQTYVENYLLMFHRRKNR